jgi:hypothetical protein
MKLTVPSSHQKIAIVSRVARWYIFKPKIPVEVYILEGLGMENFGTYILCTYGIFKVC